MIAFNLYMIRKKSMDKSRSIKIEIKFTCDKAAKSVDKFIGAPLFVWVNESDTLQYVVDKYLRRVGNILCSVKKYNKENEKET